MKTFKKIIIACLFMAGLMLLTAEAENGNFDGTILMKVCGILTLILVPVFWNLFKMDQDESIKRFLKE